ncbi:MAG TPA: MFS transporter [Syntrophomonas sp.]|nr:MFS transporter [Syntrophomonas sp.]
MTKRTTKNTSKTMIKIAIISMCLTDSANGVVTPALGTIAAAWPHISATMIQNIGSVAAVAIGVAPLIFYTPLAKIWPKRRILWLGVAVFMIGGIGPAFITTNFMLILVFRALLGFGIGILTPLGIDLCCAFFEGSERRTLIGLTSTAIGASGIIFQTIGGILCTISWNYTFYAYAAGGLFFAISIIFLPEPPRQEKLFDTPAHDGAVIKKEKLPGLVWGYAIIVFFAGMAFYSGVANVAMVAIGEGFMQPVQIGMAFNVMVVSCMITGALFGPMTKYIRYWTLPIAVGLGGVGLLICSRAASFLTMAAGLFLVGLLLGLGLASVFSKATTLAPASKSAIATSLPMALWNIGQFFEPAIFNSFVGAGRSPMVIGAVVCFVLTVVLAIMEKAIPYEFVTENA